MEMTFYREAATKAENVTIDALVLLLRKNRRLEIKLRRLILDEILDGNLELEDFE